MSDITEARFRLVCALLLAAQEKRNARLMGDLAPLFDRLRSESF